ncbi:hypothetical protein B0H10DRAFT_1787182 [Mycena sp. CBHHK59/15]|nr:hypothetical protein B0H10DRAFT_1787182 [Mycena sp. CBHHK59/15]
MSGAFTFLPRKVVKAASAISNHEASSARVKADEVVPVDKGKRRETEPTEPPSKSHYSDEDYTLLFCLSLSKHALWSNADLRRKIEWSAGSNDGFFPLSYVLDLPSPLSSTHASETVIVKALRTYATHIVDVRMAIASGENARGNFEIRPKFWDIMTYPSAKEGWESNTVYAQNIPVKYKTLAGFSRFILALLPTCPTVPPETRIQRITLPPHHSDPPGTEPKCKSFALFTFARAEDAQSLLAVWPWARYQQPAQDSADASEAHKFGFRTLSKARWDELNAEYLAYRAKILDRLDGPEVPPASSSQVAPPDTKRPLSPTLANDAVQLTPASPYPPDCLVFVRNIHPDTNKTTLRALFAKALPAKDALDYVDFNKGMDSCYFRLTTSAHAHALVDHFAQHKLVQVTALDDSGCASDGTGGVEAELVQGKKEALYWEKVPEKICRQAVQKALGHASVAAESEAGTRQRKRQKW